MHDFYQNNPCVCFSSSADGLIIEVNQTLCQFLGYSREELIGQKLEKIFSLATRIFHQTHFYPLLQLKGHAEEIYITLRSKSKDDLALLINAVRTDADGDYQLHYAGIPIRERKKYEDEIVAARKAAEKALAENQELKVAKEDLQEQSEKLDQQVALAKIQNQELMQINHLVTHTLQEPVRKLMYFSSKFSENEVKSEKENQQIRKTIEDMQEKLKGLQQYVWLANGKLTIQEVRLSDLFKLAEEKLKSENPDLTISIDFKEIPIIEADYAQMKLLILEIISNSIQFRKPGNLASLEVNFSIVPIQHLQELSGDHKNASFLKLQIQDSGIGFDDNYQEQVFEFFRKLHPSVGQGIGLSLCKKIIENHGGSIFIKSQPGEGTCVNLFLPLKQENSIHLPSQKTKDELSES